MFIEHVCSLLTGVLRCHWRDTPAHKLAISTDNAAVDHAKVAV